MTTKNEFIARQHDEVKSTLEKLNEHRALLEEKVQEDPENKKWPGLLAEAAAGVAALEPIMSEFDRADVDPEELIAYSQKIEDWQAKEKELAAKLA
jgi:hypothetical protein